MSISAKVICFLLAAQILNIAALARTSVPDCAAVLPQYLQDLDTGRTPQPLPIPPSAFPPTIRDVGYNLNKLRPGVFSVHDGTYYSMIVLRRQHLVLLDDPAPGLAFSPTSFNSTLTAAAALEVLNGTIPKRIDIVFSHQHFDHIGNAPATKKALTGRFPRAKIRVIASEGARDFIAKSNSMRAIIPTHTFRKKAVLRVGGKRGSDGLSIVLKEIGGHTEDDILAYFPPSNGQQGIVFIVDILLPGFSPAVGFGITQNLREYLRVHDIVLKLDFATLIGGHYTRTGTREDVQISKEYALFVIDASRRALANGPNFTELAESQGVFDRSDRAFGNFFLTITSTFDTVDSACARDVIAEWGCRLASTDVLARSQCMTARFFNIVDM